MSQDLLNYNLDLRLRILIHELTKGRSDWTWLEEQTEVSAEKWRNFNRGQTKASVEMVEAICSKWPQYAFWLTTGVSDENAGHHAPRPYLGFPRLGTVKTERNTEITSQYFHENSRAIKKIWPWSLKQLAAFNKEDVSWDLLRDLFFQGFTLSVHTLQPKLPNNITEQIIDLYRKKEVELRLPGGVDPLAVAEMDRDKWGDEELEDKKKKRAQKRKPGQ